MQRRWILPAAVDGSAVRTLSRELGVPRFVAEFLVRREFHTPELASLFLQPRLRSLTDPNLLPQMPAAVKRIESALRNNESIVLFGDYDVDGVSALAVLYRTLMAYGARVQCFLPLRAEEGYGLSEAAVARCLREHQPQLLIAVDCGTSSTTEIDSMVAAGVDVIVLDHHEPGAKLPNCSALVNPKVDGEEFSYLCSAGIAFKTAHALLKSSPLPGFDLKELLDLVALATLCDLVPVVAENRILVRHGLQQMAVTRWPGLAALMAVAGVRPPVCGADAGFRLGPRINAAGRLGTAWDALNLLLTNNPSEATAIAAKLESSNRERQNVERAVGREVEEWISTHFDPTRHAAIVVGAREWHTGVLGIVASRVMRQHHRPSLIIGFDESGAGRGSGRSVEGMSMVDALGRCADFLEQFGGHEMAAGVTLHESRFEEFRAAFEDAARNLTTPEMLVPRLHLDAELHLDDFTDAFMEAQFALEPFGNSNTQPVLFTRNVTPLAAPRVIKEKHLRLQFPAGRQRIDGIFFNGATPALPRPPWDIAFHLERNAYNGRVTPQLQILDLRASQ